MSFGPCSASCGSGSMYVTVVSSAICGGSCGYSTGYYGCTGPYSYDSCSVCNGNGCNGCGPGCSCGQSQDACGVCGGPGRNSYGCCGGLTCFNGGLCLASSTATCTCVSGYAGNQCQINIDDCPSNPCQGVGTCTDLLNDYYCTCPSGYSGSGTKMCTPLNCNQSPPAVFAASVSNCIGTVNGATCAPVCASGYLVGGFFSCSNAEWFGSPVCNLVTCPSNAQFAPSCVCNAGYSTTDNPTINTLAFSAGGYSQSCSSSPCPSNSFEIDLPTDCVCAAGFAGTIAKTSIFPFYSGTCVSQPCPLHSQGTNLPTNDCRCLSGYRSTSNSNIIVKAVGGVYFQPALGCQGALTRPSLRYLVQ